MNFLGNFIETNDELKNRMLTMDSFGQPMDNEANDVPLYDQYNRGLSLTQQDMSDRVNLSIDPRAEPRCGLTGMIPSVEEGLMQGAMPQPRQLVVDMGQLAPEEMEVAMQQQRKLQVGINR